MRILIVDDEPPARRRMARLLSEIAGVEVVGEADSGDQALALVASRAPDVLLLDVRMPGLDGLELVARYAQLPPVIFVTAHAEFAVRAFELDAIDYLLKPVRVERLAAALDRLSRRRDHSGVADVLSRLVDARRPERPRVVVIERNTVRFFDARTIARYRAEEKYTLFHAEGAEHLTLEPLSGLEARLAPHGYLRVHRSELIDVSRVRSLHGDDGLYRVELDDGEVARVSRRRAGQLRAALNLDHK